MVSHSTDKVGVNTLAGQSFPLCLALETASDFRICTRCCEVLVYIT